jgi:thiol-disulfide isomerase/thioredoxin
MQKKGVFFAFLIVLVVLAACQPAALAPQPPAAPGPQPVAPPMPPPPEPSAGPAAAMAYQGEVLAGTSAPLLDFTKADYDKAVQSDRLIVLYFYATWCPICRAEVPKLSAAFDQLGTDDVIGFRVNYNDGDTDADEEALAREFGVAYQHTKVFLRGGQRLLKAPDSWDTARYLSEISKHRAS